MPDLIAGFHEEHPRVRFAFEHSLDALGSSLVAGGRTDLEITARRPRNPDVEWERLLQQPLCLAVPPGHALADRDEVALAEAAAEDFVLLGPDWELRALSDELCARAGFVPRVAFEEDDIPVVRGFVAAGLGVAIVPALPAEVRQPASGAERLVRLTDPGAFRDIGLAWSKNRRLLPSAELFRRHVLSAPADRPRCVRMTVGSERHPCVRDGNGSGELLEQVAGPAGTEPVDPFQGVERALVDADAAVHAQ